MATSDDKTIINASSSSTNDDSRSWSDDSRSCSKRIVKYTICGEEFTSKKAVQSKMQLILNQDKELFIKGNEQYNFIEECFKLSPIINDVEYDEIRIINVPRTKNKCFNFVKLGENGEIVKDKTLSYLEIFTNKTIKNTNKETFRRLINHQINEYRQNHKLPTHCPICKDASPTTVYHVDHYYPMFNTILTNFLVSNNLDINKDIDFTDNLKDTWTTYHYINTINGLRWICKTCNLKRTKKDDLPFINKVIIESSELERLQNITAEKGFFGRLRDLFCGL
jgi:hypothetical protein